jgi:hypothetical protein
MRRSRAIIGGSHRLRAGVVLLGASMLTGCPSAVAIRVPHAGPDTACVAFRWLNSSLAARSRAKVVAQHQQEIVAFLEGDARRGAAR